MTSFRIGFLFVGDDHHVNSPVSINSPIFSGGVHSSAFAVRSNPALMKLMRMESSTLRFKHHAKVNTVAFTSGEMYIRKIALQQVLAKVSGFKT